MLSLKQQISKRFFDLVIAFIAFVVFVIPTLLFVIFASVSTKSFGIFSQKRVGQYGNLFMLYKIKSMRKNNSKVHITTSKDLRVTRFGKFLRRTKMDELPQLWNVLIGDMSFVGPRPDVAGYADVLEGNDRIVLSVKPGITGPATIKFSSEEELLGKQEDPIKYNDEIIWPEKVAINKLYVREWSLKKDLNFVWITFKQLFH